MKHFTVKVIDLEKYKSVTGPIEVVGGSRPRITLTHKDTNQKLFFKTYTHNPREVWAECLASHLAELVGIDAQQVTIKIAPKKLEQAMRKLYAKQLPVEWKPVGTLARNIFTKGVEITYGSAILATPSKAMTLEDIEASISKRYYAPEDLLQAFSDMVVFDAFIGNMDRHHENWGVCEEEKYKQQVLFDPKSLTNLRNFTPLFDHGSSLMFELSDKDVEDLLADDTRLERYIDGVKFGFLLDSNGDKAGPIALMSSHIQNKTKWGKRFKKSLQKIKQVDLLDVAELIIQMPVPELLEYSSDRRSLLYKSILLRYNKLITMYEELV